MSAGPIRCFIGLPLPEEPRVALVAAQKRLKALGLRSGLAWANPATAHVTLRFLGEIPPERAQAVAEALTAVACAPFDLVFGGGGFFPAAGSPKAIWAGLAQGGKEITELARRVDLALSHIGFPAEPRRFSPHLTIARVKRSERDDWRAVLKELSDLSWPLVRVDRMVFWRSVLGPGGAAHHPLAELKCETGG